MYNSNHIRYNNLVNFSFMGTGLSRTLDVLDRTLPGQSRALAGVMGLGSIGAGYLATRSEQDKAKNQLREIANTQSDSQRQALASKYTNTNEITDALGSDINRGVATAAGGIGAGLLGIGAIGLLNKSRKLPFSKGLPNGSLAIRAFN